MCALVSSPPASSWTGTPETSDGPYRRVYTSAGCGMLGSAELRTQPEPRPPLVLTVTVAGRELLLLGKTAKGGLEASTWRLGRPGPCAHADLGQVLGLHLSPVAGEAVGLRSWASVCAQVWETTCSRRDGKGSPRNPHTPRKPRVTDSWWADHGALATQHSPARPQGEELFTGSTLRTPPGLVAVHRGPRHRFSAHRPAHRCSRQVLPAALKAPRSVTLCTEGRVRAGSLHPAPRTVTARRAIA